MTRPDRSAFSQAFAHLSDALAWIREIDPARVLDLHAGGRWATLLREFAAPAHRPHITALAPAAAGSASGGYDACVVTASPAGWLAENEVEHFDLGLLDDFRGSARSARELIDLCLQRCDYVLIALPADERWRGAGDPSAPPLIWNEGELAGHAPLLLVRYKDQAERALLAGVLSRHDPRELAGRLERVTAAPVHRIVTRAGRTAAAAAPTAGELVRAVTGISAEGCLHVALVSREFPPFFGGGISTYAGHLARLHGEAGQRLTVFTLDHGGDYVAPPNVTVIRGPGGDPVQTGSGVMDWLGDHLRWGRWLSAAVAERHAEQPFDLVELTDYYLDDLFLDSRPLLDSGGQPLPIVTQFHGPQSLVVGLDEKRVAPLIAKLESVVLQAAPFRKTYSPRMATQVDELWPGSRCAFIPPAYYPAAHGQPSAGGEQRRTDFLYFGRLERRKGVDFFAEALKLAASRGLRPVVTFVGRDTNTAPGEQSMARWIEQTLRPVLGDGLHMVDSMPPSALAAMLQRARVAVLPSTWESLGYTILEAFCSGTPALVSHLAGAAYLVSGDLQRKTLIDVRETDRFAVRLAETLALSDRERAEWGGQLQLAVRRGLAAETVAPRTIAYYRECIAHAAERMPEARRAAEERRKLLSVMDDIVRISAARRGDLERLEYELNELRARRSAETPPTRIGLRQTV